MRRLGLLALLALTLGCNELIDTGRFSVRDGATGSDGGPGDAGPDATPGTDGGPDACAGTVWYRDSDGDLHGDPDLTMMSCEQPMGYVA